MPSRFKPKKIKPASITIKKTNARFPKFIAFAKLPSGKTRILTTAQTRQSIEERVRKKKKTGLI